ncbi:MAG: universal stress protein [Gammaproteobacteria bacterium]|uniref:Universal stress protein n=1 Tax=Candidatus Thiopontia autotrophica TaxID=2841688 RepID=A0A8J6P651_9GAMM|nr:universal stress protein [Candidatus Thiopontia autotrophica]MBL6968720.1 universal stress protein [Gammaproteobacteria bacterium]
MEQPTKPDPLPTYQGILLAVDSSDHSNRGTTEAFQMAAHWGAKITGTHVYAAKLHDIRFRQMEGGLPEQFREELELERQRDVHDDLITKGLSIITDSYLDQAEELAAENEIAFDRRPLEGKNYRELTRETNSGRYDLLVMGALGLGAIRGSRLGTVTDRVARRSEIDVLVIKEPEINLERGPIVVAIDGSDRAYGGLLTAFSLAKEWSCKVKVISAFDPYYHYVAFNRIAGVLSEEAGKVFKFKEQEKLHEEIIDSGLAKIYQGHLDVAESIARDYGVEIETTLLDGKAHDAVERYVANARPSLLVIGKLGIHADDELDIGGNSEILLRNVECAVLLSQRTYRPEIDVVAETTTSWTNEAESRMDKVPSFVRNMARMAILRYAQERGHTVITERIVEEATAQLMPNHAEQAMGEIVDAYEAGELKRKPEEAGVVTDKIMRWDSDASQLLMTIEDLALRGNLSMRAEKKARGERSNRVKIEHIRPFIGQEEATATSSTLTWGAAALARLSRVPEGFMRDSSRDRIESYARDNQLQEITLEVVEAGLEQAREAMTEAMQEQSSTPPQPAEKKASLCPFANLAQRTSLHWSPEAEARMERIPEGFMRDLTKQRVEQFAKKHRTEEITEALVEEKYSEWAAGSKEKQSTMVWDPAARARIKKIPDFVQGMVVLEVERCARELGLEQVTHAAVDKASDAWEMGSGFHSESNPDQYK